MEGKRAPSGLEELGGVGPALAARIRAAYGSDQAFLEACRSLDLDRLLRIEGLSERRAFDLAAAARGHDTLATTDRALDVRRELEDLLSGFAHTSFGKRSLRLLPTLRDAAAIETMQARVARMRSFVESVDRAAVERALASLAPLREPASSAPARLVVVDSDEEEAALRERAMDRGLRFRVGPGGLLEARESTLALYAGGGDLDWAEAENIVRVKPNEPAWRFVPEAELAWANANKTTLRALAELARLRGKASRAEPLLSDLDQPASPAHVDYEGTAREAIEHAKQVFAERLRTVQLQGDQILEILGAGLPRPIAEARQAATEQGLKLFRSKTGSTADLFEEGLPLRLDVQAVREARARAETEGARVRFERAQAAAGRIHEARAHVAAELREALEFDVAFALGCYAVDLDAEPATTGTSLRFEAARNVRLARKSNPQPIDYQLGGTDPVAVLTGANSGGKSSLLELLAQLVLLHHWGLPVPARRAEIPLLDELLLFAGLRGADAGALETFLRELFPPIVRPGRKLVLLDEVESMTELEAAGRILGVFLDEVGRTDSLCVLVTHLPNEVLANARRRVRVDGIDAVGLDEKHNLIVDRQPKLNHRARSTPELILRRVHARSHGPVKELFGKILAEWKG